LRDRPGDVALLSGHFWTALEQKYKRQGPRLGADALAALANAPWRGNVRELRSMLEKIFALSHGEVVKARDVTAFLDVENLHTLERPEPWFWATGFREARRLFEREYVTRKLREHGENVTRTAAAIGLERQSLQEKIRQLGIIRPLAGDFTEKE
jgi:two-component system nitrogen regulation response regulator NtrX